MAAKLSPEEQLFKVIKEGSQAAIAADSTPPPSAFSTGNLKRKPSPDASSVRSAPVGQSSLSGSRVVAGATTGVLPKAEVGAKALSSAHSSMWTFLKDTTRALIGRYALGGQHLAIFRRIEVINRSLAIFLVILLCGFIYTIALGRPSVEKAVRNLPRPRVNVSKSANHEAYMAPEAYVKISRQRDIFSRDQRAAGEGSVDAEKSTAPRNKTDLQLVGIYFSAEPEVIIEDKVKKKTYFLKKGDNINEIKVKNILLDRVILESDGTDWSLL